MRLYRTSRQLRTTNGRAPIAASPSSSDNPCAILRPEAGVQLTAKVLSLIGSSGTRCWLRSRRGLVQYRLAAQGRYAAGSTLLLSLPAITPPGGSTPRSGGAFGARNAGDSREHLSWTASTNPNLKLYAVRACDPPRYRAADEVAVEIVLPPATTLATAFGLGLPGPTKFFKVYVVANHTNKKGSNSVKGFGLSRERRCGRGRTSRRRRPSPPSPGSSRSR